MKAFKRLSRHDHSNYESSNAGAAESSCRPPVIHAIKRDPIWAAWEDSERTKSGSSGFTDGAIGRACLRPPMMKPTLGSVSRFHLGGKRPWLDGAGHLGPLQGTRDQRQRLVNALSMGGECLRLAMR